MLQLKCTNIYKRVPFILKTCSSRLSRFNICLLSSMYFSMKMMVLWLLPQVVSYLPLEGQLEYIFIFNSVIQVSLESSQIFIWCCFQVVLHPEESPLALSISELHLVEWLKVDPLICRISLLGSLLVSPIDLIAMTLLISK